MDEEKAVSKRLKTTKIDKKTFPKDARKCSQLTEIANLEVKFQRTQDMLIGEWSENQKLKEKISELKKLQEEKYKEYSQELRPDCHQLTGHSQTVESKCANEMSALEKIKSCLLEWEAINNQDLEVEMTESEGEIMELVAQNSNSLASSSMQSGYITITTEEYEVYAKEWPEIRYRLRTENKDLQSKVSDLAEKVANLETHVVQLQVLLENNGVQSKEYNMLRSGGQDASRENASSLTGESKARNTFGVKGSLPERVAEASPSTPNARGHNRHIAQRDSIISSQQSRDQKRKMAKLSPPTDEIIHLDSSFTSSRAEAGNEAFEFTSQLVVAKKREADNDISVNSGIQSRDKSSDGFSSEAPDSVEHIERVKRNRSHAERVQCKNCDKIFDSRETLDIHILMHRGERFQCTVCFKVYTQKRQLDLHMKTYNVCDEAFDRHVAFVSSVRAQRSEKNTQ